MVNKLGHGSASLAATICQRFYIDGDSKSKIAEDLQMSRFQIARLLEFSVAQGIVRFEISTPGMFDAQLSEVVRKEFGLQRAVIIVIPEHDENPRTIRQLVGGAAAIVLSETVTRLDVLGIGWGRTLSAMASQLHEIEGCPIVQMGGVIGSVHENSLETVRKVSSVGGGEAFPLYAPMILQDESAARSMRAHPGILAASNRFDSITVGAVSVGSWNPPDSQLLEGLSEADRALLSDRGVVGEICSTLLRDDGSTIGDLESRSISVTTDQLRHIRNLILVAGGAVKARAVRAAIRGGLGTTLVADRSLARALLKLS